MYRSRISLVFFVAALFAGVALERPSPALADYIQPGQVVVRTRTYTPAETNFPLGTYEYEINWQGIPVGTASITVGTGDYPVSGEVKHCFSVAARARTGRVIRLFYNLNHLSESVFRADSLTPIRFHTVQTENSKTKSRDVTFGADGSIKASVWKDGKDAPDEIFDFVSQNQTFDPIAAAFLARSLPVSEGEQLTFDVFNGKHRFLITMSVVGREQVKVDGVRRDAYKVIPTVKKLTDTEGEKGLRSATIWISADNNRDVLKLKSEVFVGSVNAELLRFIPAAGTPDAAARAALKSPSDATPAPEMPKP